MKLISLIMIIIVVLFAIYIITKGIVTKSPYPMEPRPPQEVIESITKKPPKCITVVAAPCRIILETKRLTVKRGGSATLRLTLIGIRNETTTVYLVASYGERIPGFISLITKGVIPKERLLPEGIRVSFDRDKITLSKGEKARVTLRVSVSPTFKKGVHILTIIADAETSIGGIGSARHIELIVKD